MTDTSTLGDDASQSFALPRLPRVTNAGEELEQICIKEFEAKQVSNGEQSSTPGFPINCLPVVKLFAGNHCCVDCGDNSADALEYGSIGYGTLLCQECACRHTVNTQDQSNIKSLTKDVWDLHSILSLFEGGNTKMLEYIKDKPRWRPKGKKTTGDSDDVISFKQIYLSKAATAYRANLANKVELLYQSRMEAMKKEVTVREEKSIRRKMRSRNPFMNVFDMNDVSPKDIPGMLNSGANIGFRKYAARPKIEVKKVDVPSSSASYTVDSAQLDLIKERINLRRSMGPSTANEFSRRLSNSSEAQASSFVSLRSQYDPYFARTQSLRRRSSDLLVGEVGDHLIQGQDDYSTQFPHDGSEDYRNSEKLKPKIRDYWLHNQDDQAPRLATRGSATLGTYRRLSSIGHRGSDGTLESSRGGQNDPPRPQFRPPLTN